jgi:GTP-binding protein
VTRDRLYGTVVFERWQATIVDTGGFEPRPSSDLVAGVRSQVLTAVDEADLVIFVVDGRAGLTPLDEEVAAVLRKSKAPVLVAVNKVDTAGQESAIAEYYRLGFSPIVSLSAEHGRGVAELLEAARELVPTELPEATGEGTRVAVIGRPNVGKSSLVNAVLGHEARARARAAGNHTRCGRYTRSDSATRTISSSTPRASGARERYPKPSRSSRS